MTRDCGRREPGAARADFLVERRVFPTADVRSAGAARKKTPPLPRLTAERPQDPTLDRRRLHSPFAAQGRGRRIDAGSCPGGGPAPDTSNLLSLAHVLNELRA